MASITFLGTGNFVAPDRYWNSFVLDGTILVETAPTALPHLRRCGIPTESLDAIVVSHFHADHTFGWPFLVLEALARGRDRPLFVVGPPGVEAYFADMMRVASVMNIHDAVHAILDVQYVEVDGSWQDAGPLRFRAIEVDHVAHLQCYGYLFDRGGEIVGYSGDTKPCSGLDELAGAADVLVLECNGSHPPPPVHMDERTVRELRARFPQVPFILTHLGPNVDASGIPLVTVPDDFQTLTVSG